MQPVHSLLDGMLAGIIETGNILDPTTVFVGLLTGITDNGVDTVVGDLTQADVTQYPRQEVTAWTTIYRLLDGTPAVDGPLMTFAPPDSSHAISVVGYAFFTAGTGGTLLGFTSLATPVPLSVSTDHFNLVPRMILPASAQYEDSHWWNG